LSMNKVEIVNGPNLNFLGIREIEKYGSASYKDLVNTLEEKARELNLELKFFQSNIEGEIVDVLQNSFQTSEWIVINPGAYTHTSIAIRDCLAYLSTKLKIIEVHLTDINNRENFRNINLISEFCEKSIIGKGIDGYIEALEYINEQH
jgi:3-dehydroquinate dehydratase-2